MTSRCKRDALENHPMNEDTPPVIQGVWMPEPMREGETPDGALVGRHGVTRIERRTENYGEYGISWFDVFKGDVLAKSFNARYVAEVHYAPSPPPTQENGQ
jgi:hypothetical protein